MEIKFGNIESHIDISSENVLSPWDILKDTDRLGKAPKMICEDENNHQITIDEYLIALKKAEQEKKHKEEIKQKYSAFMQASFDRDNRQLEEEREILRKMDTDFPYIAKPVNTNAELQMFNFMQNNIILKDAVHILSMVRLADFIDVNPIYKKHVTYQEYELRSKKLRGMHIDFLICRADNLKIICAYELDDYTHENEKRKQDDAFKINVLNAAGIKLLRYVKPIKDIQKSDLYYLNILIGNEFAPKCPECGQKMITKQRISDKKYFFACFDNINCRCTQEINNKEDIENG